MKISEMQSQIITNNKLNIQNPKDVNDQKDPKLVKSSKELEALFISYVLKSMEKTIPNNDSGEKNSLSKMMFSTVMGKEIAAQGGIGLADFIYKSLAETGANPLDKIKENFDIQSLYNLNTLRSSDE